jgi:hypothetical protein
VQTAAADTDPKTVRILNRLGHDLDSTGLSRVAKAVDRLPASYYDMADFAGLIYNNPLAEARLSRYPGFLTLAERPEFQALGSDATFAKLRQERNPMLDLIHNPSVASIITNPDLLNQIWTTVAPNLKDLQTFLDTGKSPKYAGQKIVGRWSFSVNGTMTAQRRAKPNISSSDMKKFKQWVTGTFAKSSFVAMPENQAILKNTPLTGVGAGAGAILNGRWQDLDGVKYQLSFTGGGGIELPASVEGERLTIKAPGAETPAMVFERED